MGTRLTGSQLQWLIDKFHVALDLEEGVVFASKKGQTLKASTVAKMVGLKETPTNWVEENGRVRGL